jgi:hypothetical protein
MKDSSQRLPSADNLLQYDIILFSKSRFEKEHDDGSDSQVRPTHPLSQPVLSIHIRGELPTILGPSAVVPTLVQPDVGIVLA